MAAYAALLSLNHIIEQLQHHPRPPISMDQNHVQSLIQNITFLQDFLEVYSHARDEDLDRLQSCIAEAAYAAEDVIESHIVEQILAKSTTHGEQISSVDFYQGLQKVIQDMDFIKTEAMEIKEMGVQKNLRSSIPAATSFGSSSVGKITMVGFDDVLEEIMDKLTQRQSNRQIIPIVGMGGIGKTTLAKNVYENPLIVQRFDIRGWATLSRGYSVKEILLELLCDQGSQESLSQMSEEELGQMLYKNLYGRRYLIIMDDMWNIEAWDRLKRYFPRDNCGSGIVITSRLSNLDLPVPGASGIKMSFLNEDKSWDLFCKIVFGEYGCPLELEKIGKTIVQNCKGLPLSIVVIGGLLAKSEQAREYWEYIAKNLNSIVNLEDNERCLNLLYMSYNYLPVHLKPCFLYMGVFIEDKIRVSELIKLLVAEGFLKPISGKSLEEVAKDYLKALIDRNLILVDEWSRNGEIKLCKMHDLLRDLSLREAQKNKFLYVKGPQSPNKFPQDINIQRRIAIHQIRKEWAVKANEYSLSEICDALQSATLARSLICISQKILPSLNIRLPRVLKAIDKADYDEEYSIDFPFQLVNLRYLAMVGSWYCFHTQTIPSLACTFWNLQTLIIHTVPRNTFDIWKMPLLRHVKLMWLYISDPGQDDFVLENLQTLSGIGNFKCGEEVVKRIPNIQKLKIFYNVSALTGSHYCLNNLSRLRKLETLNCDFPGELSWSDLVQNLTFPHSLKKLTIQGCNLHWGDMSTMIGSLPHLQVLKLGWDSFIGLEWETVEGQFLSLKFLKIWCKELECWTTEASHFPCLEHLVLYHLTSLKEIPSCLGDIPTLRLLEVDSCSNAALVSAKEIEEEQHDLGNQDLRVRVRGAHDMPYEELKRMARRHFLLDY